MKEAYTKIVTSEKEKGENPDESWNDHIVAIEPLKDKKNEKVERTSKAATGNAGKGLLNFFGQKKSKAEQSKNPINNQKEREKQNEEKQKDKNHNGYGE